MRLIIDIKDTELEKDDKKLLKKSLNVKTDKDLEQALTKLSKSAIFEYLSMFFEDGMPHSADEVKQHRLYLMILHYYRDRIPCEAEISSIFQLTNSQSKTLLRNTIASHQLEIGDQIKASLRAVIDVIVFDKTVPKYEIVIESEVFRDELNLIVAQNFPKLILISRKKGKAAVYVITQDTYLALKEYFK